MQKATLYLAPRPSLVTAAGRPLVPARAPAARLACPRDFCAAFIARGNCITHRSTSEQHKLGSQLALPRQAGMQAGGQGVPPQAAANEDELAAARLARLPPRALHHVIDLVHALHGAHTQEST